MKIACTIHSLNGGGAERVMAGLASRLGGRGHEVTLITLDDASADRHEVDSGVCRVALDVMGHSVGLWQKIANTRRRVRLLRAALTRLAPDVVLSFCDRTNILTLQAAARLPCPVVVAERSDPGQQQLGAFWQAMRGHTYRRAAEVVALTESSANALKQMGLELVSVIPSAVDEPPLHSDRVLAQQARLVIGIGRLEAEKGFDRLMDAFAAATKDHRSWRLQILGEGSLREQLLDQASRLGIDDRIELPGWVTPVWQPLAKATLFALPSRYEGFPSALLEAMAVGVPAIAVDCESGPRAILRHEVNGLLVENETSALESGIRLMIEEPARRERWAESGKEVESEFSWEAMVDAYERRLEAVVAAAAKP